MEFAFSTLLALLAIILCIATTWRAILLRRKSNRQAKQLQDANETLTDLQQQLSVLEEQGKKFNEFQESLNMAEITTRLQKPRLSIQNSAGEMNPPERYRYVHSLALRGMSSRDIAQVLSISIHEADQLVTLARLAHPHS